MYVLSVLKIQAHYKGDAKESFAEVMHQIFIPDHTTWTQLAGLCEGVGFADLATALLDSYTTGETNSSLPHYEV